MSTVRTRFLRFQHKFFRNRLEVIALIGTGVEHVRAVSVAPRDDVDVEVKHALLPGFTRAIDEICAVKAAIFDEMFGELARGRKDGGKVP